MTRRSQLALALLTILLVAACQSRKYADFTEPVSIHSLTAPEANYRSVAWLEDDLIAFSYGEFEPGVRESERRIGLLTLSTDEWYDIALPELPEWCTRLLSGIRHLSRLPNGNLGFVQHCLGSDVSGTLYQWDKNTNTTQQIRTYSGPFFVGRYTFNPVMTVLIQERIEGGGLNNKLYRIGTDGRIERILASFERVRGPSWSLDGETIAFTGTETYPEETDGLLGWNQIESRFLYPWDLYLMNATGDDVRILVPALGAPYQLKWVPGVQSLLAFAGDSQDTSGIWLLDTASLELTRVWAENTFYDLSPDGQQMVIIAEQEGKTFPVLIDLPSR